MYVHIHVLYFIRSVLMIHSVLIIHRNMKFLGLLFTALLLVSEASSQTAPGDEDDSCNESVFAHFYPRNVKVLMDNWNYRNLLIGQGSGGNPAPSPAWRDISVDDNNVVDNLNPTYVRAL